MIIQRKRCGKCCKAVGTLIPIIVTARQVRCESWAHEKCIPLWAEMVDIKPDPTRLPVTQAKIVYQRKKANVIARSTYRVSYRTIRESARDVNRFMNDGL